MVDFSVKNTNVSDPSLGAASHVSQGVVDTSGAMKTQGLTNLIQGVGEQAISAYKGYQIGDINKETQADIKAYMDSKNNPELAKSSLTDAASTDVQTSLFKPQGETLSAVEQAQKERLATYKQALDEGVMTPDEFSDRVLTNLREATNRNPGLYQELKAEASRVLELSGITGIIKSDELIAKNKQQQAESMIKDLQDRMKREYLYYDSNTSVISMQEQLQKAEGDARSYNLQVRGADQFKMLSQAQARHWNETKGPEIIRGSIANANKMLIDIIDTNSVTAETYGKFKATFDASLDNMHQVFVESIPVNIRQDPLSVENIKMHQEGMERIKTRLANLATGEDLKKVLNNEVEILKLGQEKNLRETVDVASIEMTTKIAQSVPGIITQSPDYRKKIYDAGTAIAQGNFNSPSIKNLVPKSQNDKLSSNLLEGSIIQSVTSGDYTPFKKTMDALNDQTPKIENPSTRLQFLYNNLTAIAKQKPMEMDVHGITKVETAVTQLMNDPQFGVGTLVETLGDKKVELDILPSGHLIFKGEDADKFNQTYASNTNMALRAYANAHNTTMEKAAKTFYPRYFSSLFSTGNK
ncbi:MAG: hypothetical protein WC471_06035 [Candidatus Woesearchaeota archaeon]|jgi:hypothetical protein